MKEISNSVVHKVPVDLRKALISRTGAVEKWESLTSLGRNEFICWIESAKKVDTRAHRIKRTANEITKGKRRPCCWAGCPHR